LILDLSLSSPYEWLNPHQFTDLLRDWEQEGEPRLLAAEVGDSKRFPLSLAAFMRLAGRTQNWGLLPEAALYRMALSEEQWGAWGEWKHRNVRLAKRMREHPSEPGNTSPEMENTPPTRPSSPFQPDLATALERTRIRLDLEDRVKPLLQRVMEIPVGIPLESHQLGELVEIHSALTDLAGDGLAQTTLEPLELRVLENLRDRIGLLLSEARAGLVWSPREVPDLHLWLEILRDEE
jgi:hypothetical protein